MRDLATIISACSLDIRVLPYTVQEARTFSKEIVVSVCSKRYDGTPEPDDFIGYVKSACAGAGATVAEYSLEADKPAKWHHNQARWVGLHQTKSPWVCFLDADEVPEGNLVAAWWERAQNWPFVTAAFICYWYFRSSRYQAKTLERCGLVTSRGECTRENMFTIHERYWNENKPGHLGGEYSIEDKPRPLAHHFSWVLPKDGMKAKVSAWAHSSDRDWNSEIEREFSGTFSGRDFVHGYAFNVLPEPRFDLGI